MNTILTTRNLKFKINPLDHNPPHVHVEGGGATVRINLLTFEVMDPRTGFSNRSVNMIIEFTKANSETLMKEWELKHGKK